MVNWSTASVCKRCGAAVTSSDGVAPSGQLSDTSYPRARVPQQAKQGDTVKPCLRCGKELALSKWDSWNNFLVQCPNCGGLHGHHWNIRRVLLASFIFNAFSFLFTMRAPQAWIVLGVFIALEVGTYFLDSEKIPDMLELAGVSLLLLGPMLINAIVLIKHERDLDNSAAPSVS